MRRAAAPPRVAVLAVAALVSAAGPAAAVDGKTVYGEICQACHQPDGKGAPGVAPPLKSATVKRAAQKVRDYVPLVVLYGLSGPIESEGQSFQLVMPPFAQLSDEEIAKVADYVYGTLNGVKGPRLDAKAVAALRGRTMTAADLRAMRSAAP